MKKLKNKVFYVIFGILTVFIVSILLILNIQDYNREKSDIEDNLINMTTSKNIMIDMVDNDILANGKNKVFMDHFVYVVTLTRDGQILAITNYSKNEVVNEEKIKEIVYKVTNKYNGDSNHIGNIYFDEFSYVVKNNTLVIIDNSKAKIRIVETLKISIIIFILIEILIIYVAFKLTNWIIKPVINTFNKQKQFIADASHELKTPLSVIIACAEAFDKEPSDIKWLDVIKDESEKMNKLITDLLSMAKSEKIEQFYENEDISKLVEKSVLIFEALIFEKNIKFHYNINENIFLKCNVFQIKQLAGILMDNAIKHSVLDGDIFVKLTKEKSNIILIVKNKGEEIPKEKQEKIFDRFYKVDESRNREDNRFGLGLAIAKNIVENHNGTIQVFCENGYTTFKVIFRN